MRTPTALFLLLMMSSTLSAESAGGLNWTAPAGWKSEGTQPLRVATYPVPPTAGDHDPAECAVYFFGAFNFTVHATSPAFASRAPNTTR